FAEMVKNKPWTLATWQTIGGVEGIGVTFLEESFSGPNAPPEHRYHQQAARAVLKALLPEDEEKGERPLAAGTEIKGRRRPERALCEISGYADRPKNFADLLRVLDRALRL